MADNNSKDFKEASFNAAALSTRRINYALNMANISRAEDNYDAWFKWIDVLFRECHSKLTGEEAKQVLTVRHQVMLYKHEYDKTAGYDGKGLQNKWNLFIFVLDKFDLLVRQQLDRHGFLIGDKGDVADMISNE